MSVVSTQSSRLSVRDSIGRRSVGALAKAMKVKDDTVAAALAALRDGKETFLYDDLVCTLRDCPVTEDNVQKLLSSCAPSIGMMGREAHLLVRVLLRQDWSTLSEETVRLFCRWALTLVTAHVFYVPALLDSLTKLLGRGTLMWIDDPSQEQLIVFSNIHQLIAKIITTVPMSMNILQQNVIDNFPYRKETMPVQRAYVHNMLWMMRYLPVLGENFISLILDRLITMDVHLRREQNEDEIFSMEGAGENDDELVESLDHCVIELFKWIDINGESAVDLLLPCYTNVILPTHGTRIVQFVMMYALSVHTKYLNKFLDSLWQIVASARIGIALRQASVVHVAGFLARAKYVDLAVVKSYLKRMAEWCHTYVLTHETQMPSWNRNLHAVFHCVCQSLFYLVAFKHKTLFSSKKGVSFIESLNFPKIIMSSLNPLKYCHAGIADTFASVTRMHQIVYCHSVIEHNLRNYINDEQYTMDCQEWFPFDPYCLPKSFKWIQPVYAEYEETHGGDSKKESKMDWCDEDDFLATSPCLASRSLNSLR